MEKVTESVMEINNSADTVVSEKTMGTLYGIGVGPGAPDLLTLRAVNALQQADVILAAASPRNDHSIALSIAEPYVPAQTRVVRLDFPMTRDSAVLEEAWQKNAALVLAELRAGNNAVFLTLGDPLIYSTFGYLMQTLQALDATIPVEVIPGITSFQAAAAESKTILCEGSENLLILAGINEESALVNALAKADSIVILKAYKNYKAIYGALCYAGKEKKALLASHVGLSGQSLHRGLHDMTLIPPYLSLILAPPVRNK